MSGHRTSFLTPLLLLGAASCVPPGYTPSGGGTTTAGNGAATTGDQGVAQPTVAAPPPEQLEGAQLARLTDDADQESNPTLSPDGRVLLFVDWTQEIGDDGQPTGNVATRTLTGIGPDGGGGRTVYTSTRSQAYGPAWISDKSFVFMSDSMGSWNLVRSLSRAPNAASSVVTRGDSAPEIGSVSASPAGKLVAFDANLRGTRQIVVAGVDGSNFTVLTDGENPRLSPDGTRIAFDRADGDANHIYVIDAATGENLVQLTNGDSYDFDPAWSPDGASIVFSSNYGYGQWTNGTTATSNLFAIHADGTALTQVTTGIATSREPEWDGDGNIYFSSNDAGNFDLYRVAAPQI